MKTIEVFEKRREIVEKHCGQCRDIFKPWYVVKRRHRIKNMLFTLFDIIDLMHKL